MKNLFHVLVLTAFTVMGCAADGSEIDDGDDDGEVVESGVLQEDPDDSEEVASTASAASGNCATITSQNKQHHENDINGSWWNWTVTVKNTCSSTKKVTLDLAWMRDPSCQSVGAGKSKTFKFTSTSKSSLRKAKTC